ncbi:MAG: GNAT family N-acetyltransferase [Rhodospirillaceae bacterium]|nr:GNAT family N-acetyltransferase [Rhodospirillaceae bacterium]MBT3808997.1 GNAT family N-acetyltransferase [Rhodospirillaceae bacterium]MBT3930854.1 GNAT family N-acetyltransferase [Rhodospirillaceae bacterium]MBT4772624.1 GNAT family N-acetyltransferase [Rhodospirillaceae bacterium]MBT5358198.1 GNAT family N-acetyltransferase [Rhodospirillaceae bacterium]
MARTEARGWIIEEAPATAAEHLAQLHGLCFAPLPETPWSAHSFRTILGMPTTFALAARHDEKEASALLVCRLLDNEAEILTLCVAPGVRRSGVAKALLDVFFRHSGSQTRVVLEVAVGNAAAIALYESVGFVRVGLRPDYYAGHDRKVDALVYARSAEAVDRKNLDKC